MPADPDPAPSEPNLDIDVDVRARAWADAFPDIEADCNRAIAAAWRLIDRVDRWHEVSVVLADDAFQASLNATYRGKETPTNVLSFPSGVDAASVPAEAPLPLGDIVLALETVQRESAELDVPLQDHFSHLLVHGMLHLVGFDHETERDAEEMESLEVKVLATLGVANPYLLNPAPVDHRQ